MSAVLPDVAVLELTYRCNHKCRFCSCPWYAGMLKPGTELDAAEWRQLICEFADPVCENRGSCGCAGRADFVSYADTLEKSRVKGFEA